jgi:head-tail adaptor
MKAGRLKHWVTFEEFATEIDSDGITTETWTAVTPRIPADIVDLYGRELVAAQAIASKVSSTITIRYRRKVAHQASRHAVRHRGRYRRRRHAHEVLEVSRFVGCR